MTLYLLFIYQLKARLNFTSQDGQFSLIDCCDEQLDAGDPAGPGYHHQIQVGLHEPLQAEGEV